MEKIGSSVGVVAFAAAIATTMLLPPTIAAAATTGPPSSCTRSCGNISIPYPFGVEPGCYHATGGFNLTCRYGAGGQGSPELFLGDGTVQVLEISVQHNTVRINSTGMVLPYNDAGRTTNGTWGSGLPRSGPFFLSEKINRLLVLGCNTQVTIQSFDGGSLVSHFVSLLAEGKLVDMVDPQVLEEEEDKEVQEVATLAAMCTKLKGEERPTMREVEMALENLLVKKKQVACITTSRRNDEDGTMAYYMSTERAYNETSRQYTMEEEILLSASFPR